MSDAVYTLSDLEIFTARAAQAAIEAALQAIEDEPELPGDMPDAMWHEILRMVGELDREGLIEAFRITVRQTKSGIKERLLAHSPSCEVENKQ